MELAKVELSKLSTESQEIVFSLISKLYELENRETSIKSVIPLKKLVIYPPRYKGTENIVGSVVNFNLLIQKYGTSKNAFFDSRFDSNSALFSKAESFDDSDQIDFDIDFNNSTSFKACVCLHGVKYACQIKILTKGSSEIAIHIYTDRSCENWEIHILDYSD